MYWIRIEPRRLFRCTSFRLCQFRGSLLVSKWNHYCAANLEIPFSIDSLWMLVALITNCVTVSVQLSTGCCPPLPTSCTKEPAQFWESFTTTRPYRLILLAAVCLECGEEEEGGHRGVFTGIWSSPYCSVEIPGDRESSVFPVEQKKTYQSGIGLG